MLVGQLQGGEPKRGRKALLLAAALPFAALPRRRGCSGALLQPGGRSLQLLQHASALDVGSPDIFVLAHLLGRVFRQGLAQALQVILEVQLSNLLLQKAALLHKVPPQLPLHQGQEHGQLLGGAGFRAALSRSLSLGPCLAKRHRHFWHEAADLLLESSLDAAQGIQLLEHRVQLRTHLAQEHSGGGILASSAAPQRREVRTRTGPEKAHRTQLRPQLLPRLQRHAYGIGPVCADLGIEGGHCLQR
mmetsp:Transcript_134170/g.286938  ORF Transcript_134170/g.286938 Transcript_134170/m.286938 type:complete len:246 (+) Transcript_134170:847-1584(+)